MQALTLNRKSIKISPIIIPQNILHISKGLSNTTSIESIVKTLMEDYDKNASYQRKLTRADIETITKAVTDAIDLNKMTWMELEDGLCISVCPDSKVKQEAMDCYDGRDDDSLSYCGVEVYRKVFKDNQSILNDLKVSRTDEELHRFIMSLMESDDTLFDKIGRVYIEGLNNEYLFTSEVYWDEGVFSKFTTKGQIFYSVIRDY